MFEFDPSIDGPTPEHVRWTLVHDCPLRAGTDTSDPDQTERLLRALPYLSADKQSDTRVGSLVIHNFWSEKVWAFDCQKAVAPFGGEAEVERCCRDCPANAKGRSEWWAQCFGAIALPVDPGKREQLLKFIDNPPDNELSRLLVNRVAEKRWHRMWASFQETGSDDALNELLLLAIQVGWQTDTVSGFELGHWKHFAVALLKVKDHPELRLALSLHPAGITYDRKWQVDPHCTRCKASWWNDKRQSCEMCGHQGGRQPSRTRKRIGTRPFRPIEDFVPADQVPAIVEEWSARWEKTSLVRSSLVSDVAAAVRCAFAGIRRRN